MLVKSGRDRHICSTRHCIVVQVVAGKTLFIPARATMMHTRYRGISRSCSRKCARQNFPVVVLTRRSRRSVDKVAEVDEAARAYFRSKDPSSHAAEKSLNARDEASRWMRRLSTKVAVT